MFAYERALWDAGAGPGIGHVSAPQELQRQRGHGPRPRLHGHARDGTQVRSFFYIE